MVDYHRAYQFLGKMLKRLKITTEELTDKEENKDE